MMAELRQFSLAVGGACRFIQSCDIN